MHIFCSLFGFLFVLGCFFNSEITFVCAFKALQNRLSTEKAVSATILLYKLHVPGHLGKKKHFLQDFVSSTQLRYWQLCGTEGAQNTSQTLVNLFCLCYQNKYPVQV